MRRIAIWDQFLIKSAHAFYLARCITGDLLNVFVVFTGEGVVSKSSHEVEADERQSDGA